MVDAGLNVVVADDDEINLELLLHALKGVGGNIVGFESGGKLLHYVQEHARDTDVVILDKLMPNLSGIDVLRQMKADPSLRNIPVIIQTGDVGLQQMQESIDAGAYYYLSKPYEPSAMLSLVKAAARDCIKQQQLDDELETKDFSLSLLHQGLFKVRTPDDCRQITALLSSVAMNKKEVSLVLCELITNGIEHGSLGIGYERKAELLEAGTFDAEVTRLLEKDANKHKFVTVSYARFANKTKIRIQDEGNGFDWKKYTQVDASRFVDLNGRGIAYANIVDIPLKYSESGNCVEFSFPSFETDIAS